MDGRCRAEKCPECRREMNRARAGAMVQGWLEAASQGGVQSSFIVIVDGNNRLDESHLHLMSETRCSSQSLLF